jgi:hypothetical protein
MFHYTGGCMFPKQFDIPEHLVSKIKKRSGMRNEFINGLINMEVGKMVEVPDTMYKYATVRGRVSGVNQRLRDIKAGKELITTRQNGSTSTLVMCRAV